MVKKGKINRLILSLNNCGVSCQYSAVYCVILKLMINEVFPITLNILCYYTRQLKLIARLEICQVHPFQNIQLGQDFS
jgi:hypothetical protein